MAKSIKNGLKLNVQELNIKEAKKQAREAELSSGLHRGNAAGPMPDKKKEKNKKEARKKIDPNNYR